MTIENLEERLAAMQNDFDQAPATGGGSFDLPPDGDYQALVHRFDFIESSVGQAFLKTEVEIQHDKDYTGRKASTMHNLEDPDRIGWLKGHLSLLGIDVANLDLRELRPGSSVLQAVLDTPVEITIKTSDKTDKDGNPYRNVYINRRLGDPLNGGSDIPNDTRDFATTGAGSATNEDGKPIPF